MPRNSETSVQPDGGKYFGAAFRRFLREHCKNDHQAVQEEIWPGLRTQKPGSRVFDIARGRSSSNNTPDIINWARAEADRARATNEEPRWKPEEADQLADAYAADKERNGDKPPPLRSPLDVVGIGALNFDHVIGSSAVLGLSDRARSYFGEAYETVTFDEKDIDADINKFNDWGVPGSPDGEDRFHHRHGGSAFNAVRLIASSDPYCQTGLIGVVGTPPPRAIGGNGQRLETHQAVLSPNVNTNYLWEAEGEVVAGRCTSVVLTRKGQDAERRMRVFPGANAQLASFIDEHKVEVVRYLRAAKVIHVSSLIDEPSANTVADVLELVIEQSPLTTISFDPGTYWTGTNPPAFGRILKLTSWLFLSKREFEALRKRLVAAMPGAPAEDDVIDKMLGLLRQPGGTMLVIKYVGETIIYHRTPEGTPFPQIIERDRNDRRQVDDDTGAGDVFAACYLASRCSPQISGRAGALLGMHLAAEKVTTLTMPPQIPAITDVVTHRRRRRPQRGT